MASLAKNPLTAIPAPQHEFPNITHYYCDLVHILLQSVVDRQVLDYEI